MSSPVAFLVVDAAGVIPGGEAQGKRRCKLEKGLIQMFGLRDQPANRFDLVAIMTIFAGDLTRVSSRHPRSAGRDVLETAAFCSALQG